MTRPARQPLTRRRFVRIGAGAVGALAVTGGAASSTARRMNAVGNFPAARLAEMRSGKTNLLFDHFPKLAETVPWRPVADLPTAIEELPVVEGAADVRLFVKRDDRSAGLYGGNKVRKLEHFLAAAELSGSRTLITMGGIGTNHGLATALHGRQHGFNVRLVLFDQPVTPFVEENLRALSAAGAGVHYGNGELGAVIAARRLYRASEAAGEVPYFIMVGGSSRLGSIGYVTAALELAEQVHAGVIPEPDRLFVAVGSCGTAAGLIVGCRLAGLRTRVCAVRVSPAVVANRPVIRYLANDLAAFLREHDPTVPHVRIGSRDFDLLTRQLGAGYGHTTAASAAAMRWAAPRLALEPIYTGKALAACLNHCTDGAQPGETVLFWNTINSAAVPLAPDFDTLPDRLVQRLARRA
jgi:D-cysteine desulfhydrase